MKLQMAMLTAVAVVAGCQSQAKPPAQPVSPTVLNVTVPRPHQPSVYAMPMAPMATPASYSAPAGAGVPAYLPPAGGSDLAAPPTAINAVAPAPVIEQAPPHAAPKTKLARAGEKTYVVKRGDTLFRIARDQYGDGSSWHTIATANPGLSPANLKAGQTLVMP